MHVSLEMVWLFTYIPLGKPAFGITRVDIASTMHSARCSPSSGLAPNLHVS